MAKLETWQRGIAEVIFNSERLGTAWLCSDTLAVTAAHVIGNISQKEILYDNVLLKFPDLDLPVEAEVMPDDVDYIRDIAVLTIRGGTAPINIAPLDLEFEFATSPNKLLPEWRTYGYPKGKRGGGLGLHGTVVLASMPHAGTSYIQLAYHQGNANELKRCSGSPVLCEGRVIGIISEYPKEWEDTTLYSAPVGPAADTIRSLNRLRANVAQARASQEFQERLGPYLSSTQARLNILPYLSAWEDVPGSQTGQAPPLTTVYVRQKYRSERVNRNLPGDPESEQVRIVSVEAALERHANLVLQGDPGMGKSSMIQNLAIRTAQALGEGRRSSFVPIRVVAREFVRQEPGSFASRLHRYVVEDLREDFDQALFHSAPSQSLKWLVMIDGVDEIVDDEGRRKIIDDINVEVEKISSPYRFLVTSRPIADMARLPSNIFGHYILLPFGPDQVEEFAKLWFADKGHKFASRFVERVNSSRLKDLTTAPAMLTLAAIVYRPDPMSALPSYRADLYQKYLNLMLDVSFHAKREASFHQLLQDMGYQSEGSQIAGRLLDRQEDLLSHLALHVQEVGSEHGLLEKACDVVISENWISEVAAGLSRRRRLAPILNELLRGSGVLSVKDGAISFVHNTVREFLAAKQIACENDPTNPSSWNQVRQWSDARSREIVLFFLAIWSQRKEFQAIVGFYIRKIAACGPRGVQFAGTAVAEGVAFLPDDEDYIIQALVDRSQQWNLCLEAVRGDEFESPNPVDVLRLLPDNERLRQFLSDYVRNGGIGCPKSLWVLFNFVRDLFNRDELADLATNSTEAWVQVGAATALAQTGGRTAARPILNSLAEKVDGHYGVRLVQALNDLGCNEDLKSLAERDDISDAVRLASAVYEYNETRDERGRRRISRLLERFEDWGDLPAAMIETLAETGVVLQVLDNPKIDAGNGLEMCRSLGQDGNGKYAVPFLQQFAGDQTNDVGERLEAAELLVKEECYDGLIEILQGIWQDKNVKTRDKVSAAHLLGQTGDHNPLRELANNDTVPVVYRGDAAVKLGRLIEPAEAIEILAKLAEDDTAKPHDRLAVAGSLIALGQTSLGTRLLLEISKISEVRVKSTVKELFRLGRIDDISWIAREGSFVVDDRKFAIACLSQLGQGDELISIAIDQSQSEAIRLEAGKSLTEIAWLDEGVEAIKRLASGAHDARVRLEAARWLADKDKALESESFSIVRALALDHGVSADVRLDAAKALSDKNVDSEAQAFSIVRGLAFDQDVLADVRLEAAEFLAEGKLAQDALDAAAAVMRDPLTSADAVLKAADCLAFENGGPRAFRGANSELCHPFANEAQSKIVSLASDANIAVDVRMQALGNLEAADKMNVQTSILLEICEHIDTEPIDALTLLDWLVDRGEHEHVIKIMCDLPRDGQTIYRRFSVATGLIKSAPSEAARDILLDICGEDEVESYELLRAGTILCQAGFVDDGFPLLAALLERNQGAFDHRLDAARSLIEFSQSKQQAQQWLLEILEDDRQDVPDRLAAAEVLVSADHHDAAVSGLRQLLDDDAVDAGDRLNAAAQMIDAGHAGLTVSGLRQLLYDDAVDAGDRLNAAAQMIDAGHGELTVAGLLDLFRRPHFGLNARILATAFLLATDQLTTDAEHELYETVIPLLAPKNAIEPSRLANVLRLLQGTSVAAEAGQAALANVEMQSEGLDDLMRFADAFIEEGRGDLAAAIYRLPCCDTEELIERARWLIESGPAPHVIDMLQAAIERPASDRALATAIELLKSVQESETGELRTSGVVAD